MLVTSQFMTAREAGESWGISQRRVSILCNEGRIENATIMGNMWLIPKTAEKPDDARHAKKKVTVAKPFLKWAGGKSQLLEEIKNKLPKGVGNSITKYAEPFVGGGALLFDVLQSYNIEVAYISDINNALITTYNQIKSNVKELIELLEEMQNEYIPLDKEQRKEYYYLKRTMFNKINLGQEKNDKELAALMIFINKTCFNGLYRVNKKGEYNVPMGDYKNPLICDSDNLIEVSKLLQKVHIKANGYQQSLGFVDEKTLVYFDPPYRPLSKTSDFTSYTTTGFCDEEQKKLGEFALDVSNLGARVIISNSDPKHVDENDNFFDDLYQDFNIERINAKRMINSNSDKRGKITELLITNY